mmetsp:Transcript_125428/g.351261  ORF Transcript_125428/g.351261 Transcript_125428/m.351261 type:complete len:205 (-) Transcript_125428:887-1501(-)
MARSAQSQFGLRFCRDKATSSGTFPANNSKASMPADHTSALLMSRRPCRTSGAVYSPWSESSLTLMASSGAAERRPPSFAWQPSGAVQSPRTRTLCGERSVCSQPALSIFSRPRKTSTSMRTLLAIGTSAAASALITASKFASAASILRKYVAASAAALLTLESTSEMMSPPPKSFMAPTSASARPRSKKFAVWSSLTTKPFAR